MEKTAKIVSHSTAEQEEINYWKQIPAEEKLSVIQDLREQYINLFNKQKEYAESRERLRRFYRVIKQTQS